MNIKKLIFAVALATAITNAPTYADDCRPCTPNYECACNPLYCGAKSVQFDAGIAPIVWRHRGEVDLISCASSSTNPVFQLSAQLPKFSKLYRVPWYLGAKFGYAVTDNVEVYAEFDVLQARRKHGNTGFAFVIPNIVPAQSLSIVLGKYKMFEVYVGARYYWDRFCNAFSPFVGIKVGVALHRHVNTKLNLNGTPVAIVSAGGSTACPTPVPVTTTTASNNFFDRNNVFSGGANVGFDYCLGCNWAFVFTAEVVASAGPRTPTASLFANALPAPSLASNLILGCIETEVRFPITAGIKYNF